jgi:hypothetical protein
MKLQLVDRLRELPYRVRPLRRAQSLSWPLTADDRAAVAITWPDTYGWPPLAGIVETVKAGLSRTGVLRVGSTEQELEGVIMLSCIINGRPQFVALDFSDYHDFINEVALAKCSLYIKAQFRREGYSDARIIPGGYPVTGCDYYRYYSAYRRHSAAARRFDVVGRFGYTFQGVMRRAAVELLDTADDLHYVGSEGKVRYSRFIREAASARMCLHLPGNGSFTHRVAEFLGLGTCMLSVRFATTLHVPLEAGTHYVEIADDLHDLVDKVRYYRDHDEERERIARAGREYFDRYLHCDQLAAYYVRSMLDRLA